MVSGTARLVLRVLFGRRLLTFTGVEHIPSGPGPLILASNHLSNADPVIFGAYFPRPLFAMAKKELFSNRLVAWIWAGCNVFPVDRGTADRWALRTAVEALRRGGRLLLFVEGTRATSPGMKQAEPGVGFLIRRGAAEGRPVAVLPVAVWGSEHALVKGHFFPRRVPLHVRYGRVFTPVVPTGPRADQAVADDVAAHIAALLPPEYRGAYAEAASALAD
jgi:1-acyl-sn-glycerol-3-phosphate acyltransferase